MSETFHRRGEWPVEKGGLPDGSCEVDRDNKGADKDFYDQLNKFRRNTPADRAPNRKSGGND